MVNSRQKGKRGELDLCKALREVMGWTVRRSQQFCGRAGDSDLVVEEHPALFVECKLVQRLNVPEVMKVAVDQAGSSLPSLFHRRDREEWLVTIRLADLPRFLRILSSGSRQNSATPPPQSGATPPGPS